MEYFFYNDWFNNRKKYWFSQNEENDNYFIDNYGELIDNFDANLKKDKWEIIGILIYDQLTRHYYRKGNNNHIITYFNRKALEIVEKNNNNDFIGKLNNDEWCFYMLVYRHTNIRHYLLYVMKEIWRKIPLIPSKNFIKATYNRANFEEILDKYDDSDKVDFDKSILENNSSLYIIKNKQLNIGKFENIDDNIIIVSLSGGVDSIVCLYNIHNLYSKSKKIIAIHINYNNRKETTEEVKYLRCICNILNIPLYVRKIDEINRNLCMINDLRDLYESYTKKVRYNSYKIFKPNPTVILGHNKDDCFENILTNISYNNKYENLRGIEYKSVIDNITFIRPLIDVPKNEIYKFANIHNLPYLRNSTPNWCQRGKIRYEILPVLEKWDMRIIDGLFNLSDILKNYNQLLDITTDNFKENDIGNIDKLNLSKLYWKYGIFKLCKFFISNKSLNSLIERLEIWKNKYNKIDVNKKTKILIKKDFEIILIKRINNNYEYNIIHNKK